MKLTRPLTIIIFGATGELYQHKLAPALFNLFTSGGLPPQFLIVGAARRPLSTEAFQTITRQAIVKKIKNVSKQAIEKFLSQVRYIQADVTKLADMKNLEHTLKTEGNTGNKIFYFSIRPGLYSLVLTNLAQAGIASQRPQRLQRSQGEKSWTRYLIEKPIGENLAEAKKIIKILKKDFDPRDVFCVDHYMAKDTMQSLLNLRLSDRAASILWSNGYIERVRIHFYERNVPEDTIEKRGVFYDTLGAFKDVGQSHMLQMFALIAMRILQSPKNSDTKAVHDARGAILEKLFISPEKRSVLRGQYRGYVNEAGVKRNSKTETFFRVGLGVRDKQWKGVPFEIISGKALDREEMSIEIFFKNIDAHLTFYISSYSGAPIRNAHEKIFIDAIRGDQTLFVSTKEILASWKLTEQILKKFTKAPLVVYKKGSKPEEIR